MTTEASRKEFSAKNHNFKAATETLRTTTVKRETADNWPIRNTLNCSVSQDTQTENYDTHEVTHDINSAVSILESPQHEERRPRRHHHKRYTFNSNFQNYICLFFCIYIFRVTGASF